MTLGLRVRRSPGQGPSGLGPAHPGHPRCSLVRMVETNSVLWLAGTPPTPPGSQPAAGLDYRPGLGGPRIRQGRQQPPHPGGQTGVGLSTQARLGLRQARNQSPALPPAPLKRGGDHLLTPSFTSPNRTSKRTLCHNRIPLDGQLLQETLFLTGVEAGSPRQGAGLGGLWFTPSRRAGTSFSL